MSAELHNPAVEHGGYERTDVRTNVLAGLAIGIGLLVIVSLTGIAIMWRFMAYETHYTGEMAGSPLAPMRPPPPSPRLQVTPAADLYEMRQQEDLRLHTYGWIDQSKGVARIPIDRAMDLIAQRGLSKP